MGVKGLRKFLGEERVKIADSVMLRYVHFLSLLGVLFRKNFCKDSRKKNPLRVSKQNIWIF